MALKFIPVSRQFIFVVMRVSDGRGHPIGWRNTEADAKVLAGRVQADHLAREKTLAPLREILHAAWCACSDQTKATYEGGYGPFWPDDHPSHEAHRVARELWLKQFAAVQAGALDPTALLSGLSWDYEYEVLPVPHVLGPIT